MLKPRKTRLLFVAGWVLVLGTSTGLAGDPTRLSRLPPVVPSTNHAAILAASNEVNSTAEKLGEANQPADGDDSRWRLGEFRIRPYGFFWADMLYASRRTSPGAYNLLVQSEEDQGEGAFTIDARRTRFGLEVEGPSLDALHGAASGGRVEIDFHGNFITENRASILLRHAFWEVGDERFRVLVGQTWDVISPLNPGMLDYAPGFLGGNIGYRRTQFRAERFYTLSDQLHVSLQASLNQNIVTDFQTELGVGRESSDWPVVQGRMALTLGSRAAGAAPVVVGVSGHIGETGFDFLTTGPPPPSLLPEDDARFQTWSFNVDLHVPITARCGVQGEFFTGANLSSFLGGIGQGVCPCLRVPIRSTGGWLEVWYDWTPDLHSNFGMGLDDPRDNDSLLGRTYNHFIFANLVVDLSDTLTTGIEVTSRKTLYQETRAGLIPPDQLTPSAPGNALTIDWMVRYEF